jgi:hypothetical protein
MPARTLIWPALALTFALLASAGCELIVDFDRSKIPTAGTDAPSVSDAAIPGEDDAGADEDAGD